MTCFIEINKIIQQIDQRMRECLLDSAESIESISDIARNIGGPKKIVLPTIRRVMPLSEVNFDMIMGGQNMTKPMPCFDGSTFTLDDLE